MMSEIRVMEIIKAISIGREAEILDKNGGDCSTVNCHLSYLVTITVDLVQKALGEEFQVNKGEMLGRVKSMIEANQQKIRVGDRVDLLEDNKEYTGTVEKIRSYDDGTTYLGIRLDDPMNEGLFYRPVNECIRRG